MFWDEKRLFETASFLFLYSLLQFESYRNSISATYCLSFTVAGFHFGMDFTTRAASASSSGLMLRTMLT